MGEPVAWSVAMREALYGAGGFYPTGAGPAAHFRTSAHTRTMATAVLRLLDRVDAALGRPPVLDVVDVGAGRGELLTALAAGAGPHLAGRLRLTAVEVAARPAELPATVTWAAEPPRGVTGLLLATEWLDNVPVDVAERDGAGVARLVLVDPDTGAECLGDPLTGRDADWLDRWWPLREPGERAELGGGRDAAWAAARSWLARGLALAVDYGHVAGGRPAAGTLTGYRDGRAVPPVPDGSCDLTAHVAWDPLVADGLLLTQRGALRRLGVSGSRPPLADAERDPVGYLRALADATEAADLTDPTGLGAHQWLFTPVGVRLDPLVHPMP